ncbi:MAG: hypothetical protein QOD30_1137, partial [Actinomycetota bacterium]|nr:hypothetical protein [Actinomycetota bacterium]
MGAFVGREHELGTLRRALDEARGGRTRTVVISGDAGIGKTRLVEELVGEARRDGAQSAWGRAWEGGGAPEYWPWIEILRDLGADAARDALATSRDGDGDGAGDDGARFRLFDRVATALRAIGGPGPAVIVLEDAHVADEPTVRLAQFIARTVRDAPLLLLVTRRHEGGSALADVEREAEVVHVSALGPDDLGTMLALDGETAARIADASGGNPFFAEQLARWWASGADRATVPSGVREVVRRRVSQLPEHTATLLPVGAVVGRGFDVAVVARATDTSAADVLEALAPAVRAALVVQEEAGRFRFHHDLVRAALIDDLEPSTRARHHLAVAGALEHAPDPTAAVIAHHLWAAAPLADRSRAERWTVAAARRARASLAYEDAARHWERAALLSDAPEARFDHLMARGEALRRAGDFVGASDVLREAVAIADHLGDDERYAEAVLAMAGYADVQRRPDVVDLLDAALARLSPGDSRLRALLLSSAGTFLGNTEEYQVGLARSADALAMARRVGDDVTTATAVFNHHFMLIMDASAHDQRVALADELLALTDRVGETERRITACCWRAHDHLEAGELSEMRRLLARANGLAHASRSPFGVWATTYPEAYLELLHGRFDVAEGLAIEALASGEPTGFADVLGVHLAFVFHLRRAQGRLAELAESASRPAGEPLGVYDAMASLGLAELGLHDHAAHLARRVLDARQLSMQSQAIVVALAETAVITAVRDVAEAVMGRLEPLQGRVVPTLICAAPHGAIDRILGGLAHVLGDHERAVALLASGRATNSAHGFDRWVDA